MIYISKYQTRNIDKIFTNVHTVILEYINCRKIVKVDKSHDYMYYNVESANLCNGVLTLEICKLGV